MNRSASSTRLSAPALHVPRFNDLHADVQAQVIEHAADDPSEASSVEDAWATARFNAGLCTVSKRFQERVQPHVHLSYCHTLALIDCREPASTRCPAVKKDLIFTDPRILYQRLEKMPDQRLPLTPVQRLQLLVDAHMGIATQQDVKACLDALMGLVKTATTLPTAQLPYRAIPTLMALFLCRSLLNPQAGNAWHLSAVHLLMQALVDSEDESMAEPALLQIAVTTMVYERLGHPFIRLLVGNTLLSLTTELVLENLKIAGQRHDREEGLRAVAAVFVSTPAAPADANTITTALHCLETLDHPLIGVWTATLNKLESFTLTRESRECLDRCIQKAQQNGWAPGAAPPSQLLLTRV